jgi:hypothetical protein
MCPPLQTAKVRHGADRLSTHSASPGLVMLDGMLRSDEARVNLRNVIEILHLLHGLHSASESARSGEQGDVLE